MLGGLSLLIAVIAVSMVPASPGHSISAGFLAYAAITCGLAGFCIGYVFPRDYQEKTTESDRKAERREVLDAGHNSDVLQARRPVAVEVVVAGDQIQVLINERSC